MSDKKDTKKDIKKDTKKSSNKFTDGLKAKPKNVGKNSRVKPKAVEDTEEEKEMTVAEEYENWINECYDELVLAGEAFSKLGMKATVHGVSEKNQLPVLVIALREAGNELLAVDLSFSPFERKSLEETKWLQIGVEFPWDVPNRDNQRFIGLLNKINSYIPVGHFSLVGEIMYYRFVCSIPKNMSASSMPVLESISVISVFSSNYEEVFRRYLTNNISFNELYELIVGYQEEEEYE